MGLASQDTNTKAIELLMTEGKEMREKERDWVTKIVENCQTLLTNDMTTMQDSFKKWTIILL